jgi:hypothetical protein
VELEIVCVEFDGLVHRADCSHVVALEVSEKTPECVVRVGIVRLQANGLGVNGYCLFQLPVPTQGMAKGDAKAKVVRIEFHSPAEVRDGLGQLVLIAKSHAEVGVGGGRMGTNRHGRIAKPGCAFEVSLPIQRKPQLKIEPEISRIDVLGVP